MITFRKLRESLLVEKVTHTALSAIKSILPAEHVKTDKDIEDDDKATYAGKESSIKYHHVTVGEDGPARRHFNHDLATYTPNETGGGGHISIMSYHSRAPEHVASAAHEAHHALINLKTKGQGSLHANEQIVNKMTRKWIDRHYVGDDRRRAHKSIDVSVASYKDHLPGQHIRHHRSERGSGRGD